MSILNVVWSPSRVVVAVDTACALAEGAPNLLGRPPVGPVCKLVPLAGIGALIAARGSTGFLPMVAMGAMLSTAGQGVDFDGLLDRLPDVLRGAHQSVVHTVAQGGGPVDRLSAFECVAAGWSAKRDRMAALSFWHYDASEGLQVFELDNDWPAALAPRFDFEWEHDPPRTSAAMFGLAKLQVEEARKRNQSGIGDRLIIATATRESMTVVDHGDLSAARSLIV